MADLPNSVRAMALHIVLILLAISASASDYSRVIQSDQILSDIRNNTPVRYSGVIIVGDLDLSNMPEPITSPLIIKNSEIQGIINLNDTVMMKPVDFEGTLLARPSYFYRTRFMGGTNFNNAQFNGAAIFRKSFINQSADFEEAKFKGRVDFRDCCFEAEIANFGGAHFDGDAQFIAARFNAQNANFQWSQFDSNATFWHSIFGKSADFRGTYFGGTADFFVVQFNDTADFSGAKFEKKLYFNDAKFKTLKIHWGSIKDKLDCNGPPYLLLIKNFKDLEQFEDADSCYYQYRNWRRINRPIDTAMIFDYIAWLSCGYGVRWDHTILSGISIVIIFGIYYGSFNFINLIFAFNYGCGHNDLRKRDFKENLKKYISFSAITLLSLPAEWSPFGKEDYMEFLSHHLCSAIFERMIGWGLMLLLIGTLSRLMVRY